MMHERDIEERLSELGQRIQRSPSAAGDIMHRVEQVEIEPALPSRIYPLLKVAKWVIPLAAAAAVVLVVGLWPAGRNGQAPGHVYALSDLPALVNSARTLHVRELNYQPLWAPPDQERTVWASDYWVDQARLSWCRRETYVGKRSGRPARDPEDNRHGGFDQISDGQYVMYVNHAAKSVTYEKPTAFKLRWMVRRERDSASPVKAENLEGLTYSGQEMLDGQLHEIWELTIPPWGDGRSFKFKLWFLPQKGEVSRSCHWAKSPKTNDQWVDAGVTERFERDVEPPPGTFSTEPPAGYRLVNTKQTAEPDTLDTCSQLGQVGQRIAYGHATYELPGRVLLFAWSCLEKGKKPVPQQNLFKDLVTGGPLPKLPLEIHTLLPNPRVETLAWPGFHLTSTHRNGRYYEWTLYVPNQPAPRSGIPGYEAEYRVHTEGPDKPKPEHYVGWGAGEPLNINNAADFNEFVLGAMVELSDPGTAPADVTYDSVLKLAEQLRAKLQPAKAAR
jgi:hypothetical protein